MKRTVDSDSEEIDDESFEVEAKKPRVTDEPWIQRYAPLKLEDICINPTKLKQLRQAMREVLSGRTKLLVLTGPSGSSKSTCAKILSKELGFGYVEYTQGTRFDEFLGDCKYLVGKNLKYVIIEELPNIFHKDTLQQFRNSLYEWLYLDQKLPPMVICLTEIERNFHGAGLEFFSIENNLNANTLLGKDLMKDLRVENVKFNSIAKKFMKNTINKIIRMEIQSFLLIPKKDLDQFLEIVEIGDIRSVINNLEMWAKYYNKGLNFGELNFKRNTTINLFHAIGKVIYSSSKFKDLDSDESNWRTIEDVIDNYDNLQLLHLSVLENYTNLMVDNELKGMSYIADHLSLSELIYSLDEGKDMMIRGTRVGLDRSNKNSGSSNFNRINFTRNFKMTRQANKVSNSIYDIKDRVLQTSFDNVNLIDGYYVPLILNRRFKKNYHRVGGSIHKALDDDLYEDDNEEPLEELQSLETMESEEELSDPIDDSDERKPTPFESDYEFLDESEFL